MSGMTDPVVIKMVKEVLQLPYSQPASRSINELRNDLRNLRLHRTIFVQ